MIVLKVKVFELQGMQLSAWLFFLFVFGDVFLVSRDQCMRFVFPGQQHSHKITTFVLKVHN